MMRSSCDAGRKILRTTQKRFTFKWTEYEKRFARTNYWEHRGPENGSINDAHFSHSRRLSLSLFLSHSLTLHSLSIQHLSWNVPIIRPSPPRPQAVFIAIKCVRL